MGAGGAGKQAHPHPVDGPKPASGGWRPRRPTEALFGEITAQGIAELIVIPRLLACAHLADGPDPGR